MKKTILSFIAITLLILTACSNDEGDNPQPQPQPLITPLEQYVPASTSMLIKLNHAELMRMSPSLQSVGIDAVLGRLLGDGSKVAQDMAKVFHAPKNFGLNPAADMLIGQTREGQVYVLALQDSSSDEEFVKEQTGQRAGVADEVGVRVIAWQNDNESYAKSGEFAKSITERKNVIDCTQHKLLGSCINEDNTPMAMWGLAAVFTQTGQSATGETTPTPDGSEIYAWFDVRNDGSVSLDCRFDMKGVAGEYANQLYTDPDPYVMKHLSSECFMAANINIGKTGDLLRAILPPDQQKSLQDSIARILPGITIDDFNAIGPRIALGMSESERATAAPELSACIGLTDMKFIEALKKLPTTDPQMIAFTMVPVIGKENTWTMPLMSFGMGYPFHIKWTGDYLTILPQSLPDGYDADITKNATVYDVIKNGGIYVDIQQLIASEKTENMLKLLAPDFDWGKQKNAFSSLNKLWLKMKSKDEAELHIETMDKAANGLDASFKAFLNIAASFLM